MEIQGYSDYLIYEDGRVWSKKRDKFLKHVNTSHGYKIVCIQKKQKYVHRLIAIHFIPNPENLPQVDHINRIRSDNRIENLRWADQSLQETNKSLGKNNNSGHKGICYEKTLKYNNKKRWVYQNKRHKKRFVTKQEAIWYKFIYLMTVT